jgi:hypothetical protein
MSFCLLLVLSGGSVIIWKSIFFQGALVFQNSYDQSVEFFSLHDNSHWILTNIYAPCTHTEKRQFLQWFQNINMPQLVDWIIVGDFNLCRSPNDRKRNVCFLMRPLALLV